MPAPIDLRYLQRLAFDVFQRSPTAAERAAYVGGDPAQVVPRLLAGKEAMAAWFEEELQYFLLLDNFRPAKEMIEQVPVRLQKGELTARDALGEVLLSTGFSLRNPGNDTFVTVVLEQCLGYKVQDARCKPILAAGKAIYDGKKGRFLGEEAQNQADLIRIVLHHPDCTRHLLQRHHQRLLGAPLAKDAPEPAAVQAAPQQFFAVLGDWLQSEPYRARLLQRLPKSERQFLRGLWQDLLGKLPTTDELRNLRNALQSMADAGPLRAVLAKVVLDSDRVSLPACEPGAEAAFVKECFARFLAREPGPQETAVFVQALTQDGGTPAQIARVLVESLEYQTY